MRKAERINRKSVKPDMFYYLRRYWKENTLVILCLAILCGLQVGANMLMMQSFQGIIDRNMYRFMFWTLILVGTWFLIYGLAGVETFFRCRMIRIMNNASRHDIAKILLKKSYQGFHGQSVGEYLSQFTNDISQIEKLAWDPFFNCIRSAVTVMFSIFALLTLHWSLLAASIITTVAMLAVPKLFHQKMEHLGTVCAQKQSVAVSQLKEQLAGYDVLRFFGQEQRFIRNTVRASDSIETPKFQLAYRKGFVSTGMGCINIVCQMLHVTLIGVLSVRGIILQGALTGGGNLCGNLASGLGNMTQDILSMSSAKPYFEKIFTHTENTAENDGKTKAQIQMEAMQNGIAMDHVGFCYMEKERLWSKRWTVWIWKFQEGKLLALWESLAAENPPCLNLYWGVCRSIQVPSVWMAGKSGITGQNSYGIRLAILGRTYFCLILRSWITLLWEGNLQKRRYGQQCVTVPWKTIYCPCLTDWIRW